MFTISFQLAESHKLLRGTHLSNEDSSVFSGLIEIVSSVVSGGKDCKVTCVRDCSIIAEQLLLGSRAPSSVFGQLWYTPQYQHPMQALPSASKRKVTELWKIACLQSVIVFP